MIKIIDKITTFPGINKKAAEFSRFIKSYEGCLLAKNGDYAQFAKLVKTSVDLTNQRYPRSKPFIVETNPGTPFIYVTVQGDADKHVARIFFTKITGVYHQNLNQPLDALSYTLKEKEAGDE